MNSECVVLFSECNFKGDHIEVCENNPDLTDDMDTVKSLYIPKNFDKKVHLHTETDYKGKLA